MLLRVTIFNTSFIHGLPQVVTYIISNLSIDIAMVTMVVGPIQIHLNENIKDFNKHQVSEHLYILLLSMVYPKL